MKICNCSLIAAAVLATASLAQAQNTNTPQVLPPSPTNATPPHARALPAPGAASGQLGMLTEEQRASFQSIMSTNRAKFMELYSKYQAARGEISETIISEKLDENLIREKVMNAAKIEADMAVLRAKAYSDIQPPLTSEQVEKLKSEQRPPMRSPLQPPMRPQPPAGSNPGANGLPPKQ